MKDIWDEIADQFHDDMDNERFGPDYHSHTEGIFNDRTGVYRLKDRYQAWIFRASWGNNSQFCCHRPPRNPQNPVPLTQADAARALGCSTPVLCRMTKLFATQGRIHVDEQGRIFLNKKLKQNVKPKEDKAEYAESERQWRAYFPQYVKEEAEWDETLKKGRARKDWFRKERLRFHKRRTRSGNASLAPATGDLFRSGNDPASNSGNENTPAPVTPPEPSDTPSLDSRARSTLNTQHKETTLVSEWLEQALARETAHSLTEIKNSIESAYGAPLQDNDPIPGQLLNRAKELDLPVEGLCRWIQEWTKKKRDAKYPITSPMIYVKAAGSDLAPWIRLNADFVYRLQFARDVKAREPQAAIETLQNPEAPDDEKQWARSVLGIDAAKGVTP